MEATKKIQSMPEKCGCKIVAKFKSWAEQPIDLASVKWTQCPLHEAAEKILEALKQIAAMRFSNKKLECSYVAEEAIAKADRQSPLRQTKIFEARGRTSRKRLIER